MMMAFRTFFISMLALLLGMIRGDVLHSQDISYETEIAPLFKQYCGGCHNEQDKEGGFSVASYSSLLRGTEKHSVIQAGSPQESRLIQLMTGKVEPKMPPDDEPSMNPIQIEKVRKWIEQGARGKDVAMPLQDRLKVPSIERKTKRPLPITAIAMDPIRKQWVVGRTGTIEYVPMEGSTSAPQRTTIVGKVGQIRATPGQESMVVASGVAGVGGQISIISKTSTPSSKSLEVGRDLLYTAKVHPDGMQVATGGYDRLVYLVDVGTGKTLRTLEGHNGCIYDLDMDAQGQILATASGDETVKIWRVSTGERLDTLGQPEGEQYSVRISPDGRWVVAGGADRRIRLWRLVSKEKATINPMIHSVFAHEGSVLALAFSESGDMLWSVGEDRKVKVWSIPDMQPLGEVAQLPDTPTSIAVAPDGGVAVGLMNGVLQLIAKPSIDRRVDETHAVSVIRSMGPDPRWEMAVHEGEEQADHTTWKTAQSIPIPSLIRGTIEKEEDWYSFEAKQGEAWIVQILAAREGSPLDSRIEIYDEQGEPVMRTRLQAVRESYFTFRGKSSDVSDDFRLHRWEDMELNEWLYAGGEVVKLWLYPRGPDSGFKVYPGFGNRYTYFDTTATAHALGEVAYIVRPLAANQPAIPNGLPVFPIYYENDDEGQRRFGKDSKIHFVAPSQGKYYLRVRDARGQQGVDYRYRLSISAPRPDFSISCNVGDLPIVAGAGREFEVTAVREDGFEGPIEVQLEGLPTGWIATQPLVIQAGQHKALGTIHRPLQSDPLPEKGVEVRVVGSASLPSGESTRTTPKPIVIKHVEGKRVSIQVFATNGSGKVSAEPVSPTNPLVLRAGESLSAIVVAERGEFQGDIGFGTDDSGRNLPHGVIVGNIGLSGLLIPAGQKQQELFLEAAPWVEPQERLFHLRANVDGNPTTVPLLLRVEPQSKNGRD